jgi:hypothetical protein
MFLQKSKNKLTGGEIAAIFKLHYPIRELWFGKPFHSTLFGTAIWVAFLFFKEGNFFFFRAVIVK